MPEHPSLQGCYAMSTSEHARNVQRECSTVGCLTLKVEELRFSETSATIYQPTGC